VIGRLVQSADFERVLGTPPRARSAHFVIHHVAASPQARGRAVVPELSTEVAPVRPQAVDDLPAGVWIGAVVPKRHARRSVTRNLIKRQIRRSFVDRESRLAPGLWVVRLRAPFDPARFSSAASAGLRNVAADELAVALARATG
jgi:ribonuclease P protein component